MTGPLGFWLFYVTLVALVAVFGCGPLLVVLTRVVHRESMTATVVTLVVFDPRVRRARHREALAALIATLPDATPPARPQPTLTRRPLPAVEPETAPMWRPPGRHRRRTDRASTIAVCLVVGAAGALTVWAYVAPVAAALGWTP